MSVVGGCALTVCVIFGNREVEMRAKSACSCFSDRALIGGAAAGLDNSSTFCTIGDLLRRFGGEGGAEAISASDISSISRYGEEFGGG